jgi:hypothetical protein
MAISKRELGFLVTRGILEINDDTLVRIAELVLGKTVTMRGKKFSFKPPAVEVETLVDVPKDIEETAAGLATRLMVPANVIANAIHEERRRFDKLLEAAERTVTAFDTRGRVSYAISDLETALRDHGQCLPNVDGKVGLSEISAVTKILSRNESMDRNLEQKEKRLAKLSKPQIDVLIAILEGHDRFADRYAPALKVVTLGLANWSGKSSSLSNDRLILTEEGKARAELERAKGKLN